MKKPTEGISCKILQIPLNGFSLFWYCIRTADVNQRSAGAEIIGPGPCRPLMPMSSDFTINVMDYNNYIIVELYANFTNIHFTHSITEEGVGNICPARNIAVDMNKYSASRY
jgi:hypothetical protein